ncbi:unnamed protein product [Orchesella dallaii]|uniref:Protein bric-a-brac 1 n=1 Tax=Orchesella dallaii TaxID=48710 RepID=A0ABP1PVS5_9HEXA
MFVNGNEEMSGSVQQYCLRWNNHRSNLLLVFEHLFQTESFTDVTLACEGASIKCHKMVLAACSSYFQSLFIENECRHPIVILKDIKFSEIKAILEYMYRGEVNVAQDQLAGLLKAAETLRVKGLVEDNHHHLSESPRSPRQSPNQISSIPSSADFQPSSSSFPNKNNSYPSSKFLPSEPIYDSSYSTERPSSMQLPIWPSHKLPPSPSPKHNVGYDNTQNEPVPLKKKKFLGPNKDTPILRTVLGHTSLQHNAEPPPSQTPPQTTPLHQKSLNYSMISNTSNGPIEHNEKMRESPEQYMDDSIRSVESDKGHDDNPPYSTDPEDKHGANLANYVPVQKPEWKRYKQYTRNDIMSAIEAVRQGMSALQAARKFSVPSRTLYDKVKKLGITTNRPYRKGSFPMSPYQGLNLKTEEGAGYSPEEQSSDLPGNGNGTGSFSGNGSETDCEKMDSEPGSEGKRLTSPSMNDDKEDSNHIHDDQHLSKQFSSE